MPAVGFETGIGIEGKNLGGAIRQQRMGCGRGSEELREPILRVIVQMLLAAKKMTLCVISASLIAVTVSVASSAPNRMPSMRAPICSPNFTTVTSDCGDDTLRDIGFLLRW